MPAASRTHERRPSAADDQPAAQRCRPLRLARQSAPRRRRRTSIRRTAPPPWTRRPPRAPSARSAARSARSSTIQASARSSRSYAEKVKARARIAFESIASTGGRCARRACAATRRCARRNCGAAGADRVNAQVVGHVVDRGRGDRRAVGERDAKPGARERGRERQARKPAPAITTSNVGQLRCAHFSTSIDVILIGVDAKVAGDGEGFLHDVFRGQRRMLQQRARRGLRIRAAASRSRRCRARARARRRCR